MKTEIVADDLMLSVGIDHSVHSTGLVFRTAAGYQKLYQLTSGNTKCSPSVLNKIYRFKNTNTKTYSYDDLQKIDNGAYLGKNIISIISDQMQMTAATDIIIHMEGSIMSGGFKNKTSRVNDLVAYGTMVKFMLIAAGYRSKLHIIAPGTLKKSFTGKGNCGKDKMLEKFYELVPEYDHSVGKNDDIADAFALASHGLKQLATASV